MKGFAVAAVAVVAATGLEIVLPGRPLYQFGWYNVALAAIVVSIALAARRQFAEASTGRARLAIVAITFGGAIAGFAAVANGLLAPGVHTVVGAPGARVPVSELGGTLVFPFAGTTNAQNQTVTLSRSGRGAIAIGAAGHDIGSFILRTRSRSVVRVDARDLHGAHLTITQPTGTVFLSPVLLMRQHQTIAGMDLPFDSFAVPAAHRIVKAVLFTPQEAAMLHGASIGAPVWSVLFAADDEEDRPLPHAIALDRGGAPVDIGGLVLRAVVLAYPAVTLTPAPSLVACIIGAVLVAGGLIATKIRSNS